MNQGPCRYTGCGGTVLDDGYCDRCGRLARSAPTRRPPLSRHAVAHPPPRLRVADMFTSEDDGSDGRCSDPDCGGTILDDGYCDRCGSPAGVAPAPPTGGRARRDRRAARTPGPRALLSPGSPCPQASCRGTVIDDGYCDTCGALAEVELEPPAGSTPVGSEDGVDGDEPVSHIISPTIRIRTRTNATRLVSSAVGGGLVQVPVIHGLSAEAAVIEDAAVPENERFCSNPECGAAVGRTKLGHPGRRTGHCPSCGQWFSFEATLQAGEVLAGQYEILGPIGHGGRGWVYAGRDRNVADRAVVVKGFLNAGDAGAASEAAAEMQYLAAVEHEYIVSIYNFVAHGDSAYIVMEYVEGTTLDALLKAQQAAGIEDNWTERVLAYIAAVLEAFDYLHENQIAYNDMKPDNVMAVGRGCKLIDLGAAHRITESAAGGILATPGFYAPELPDTGPTVMTDIYTIGRTLLALVEPGIELRGLASDGIPGPELVPNLAEHESLYRLVLRATDADPNARFQSAQEMRDQLLGVLREIVAHDTETPRPSVSDLFTPELESGSIERRWQALPAPRSTDKDPAMAFVAGLSGVAPKDVLEQLGDALRSGQLPDTLDTWTQVLRICLEAKAFRFAAQKLNELDAGAEGDWRLVWYEGLLMLAVDQPDKSLEHFDQVYLAFPGEPAARLGLALACEAVGDVRRAATLYAGVAELDPSFTTAIFGLSRCHRQLGSIERAVEALDQLHPASRLWATGRIAAVELLLDSLSVGFRGRVSAPTPSALPSDVATGRLQHAGGILEHEPLDPELRAHLQRDVFDTGLALIETKQVVPHRKVKVLGRSLTSDGMRFGLEASYRELARYSTSSRDRIELIDLANFFRPTSVR